MGSGHNRELTRKQKLHPAAAASMRLQNGILERQNAGFSTTVAQQAEALIQSFSLIDVISKWIVNWLVGN